MHSDDASDIDVTLRWRDGGLHLDDGGDSTPATQLDVADSFLVTDGRVLAIELHRERFITSVRESGYRDEADVAAFWQAATQAIPREIQWFPRYEFTVNAGAPAFALRLRSAPALADTAIVTTNEGVDPRTSPRIKGPDLGALTQLREQARGLGADEVVLLDGGAVAEGSTTALLWWREGVLCQPPARFPRIDSVTARSILTIAAATGTPIREEIARPDQLDGCDVWVVNALHGIRTVTRWVDGPELSATDRRAQSWRARLRALTRPLDAA